MKTHPIPYHLSSACWSQVSFMGWGDRFCRGTSSAVDEREKNYRNDASVFREESHTAPTSQPQSGRTTLVHFAFCASRFVTLSEKKDLTVRFFALLM